MSTIFNTDISRLDVTGIVSFRSLIWASMLTGGLVTISIGAHKRKKFEVHRELIRTVPYFECKVQYGRTTAIHLKDETAECIEMFLIWLYRRTLSAIDKEDDDNAKNQVVNYVALYLRASVWGMHALQNNIMDCLRARETCHLGWFPEMLIGTLYEATRYGDPLRVWLVDNYLWKGTHWPGVGMWQREEQLRVQMKAGNYDFVCECHEELYRLCGSDRIIDPNRRNACCYHVKEEEEDCEH